MLLEQRLGIEKPLFLMDGTAFIYRGFYANRTLQRSDGFPTNALYMITRLLLRIFREQKPEKCIFFMDGRGKNFRHEIFPLYKANRDATPEELVQQFDPIKRMVQSLGITLHVSDGCEADDCIASLAKRYSTEMPVIIVGADKDLRQCLNDKVWLWDPAGKEEKLTSAADFTQETGLTPSQWPDVQALMGDTSDNIPGVPGIGPKTAQKIFMDFSSLEDIRDGIERMAPKMQQKIAPHVENIFLYRQLTTLNTQCCPEITTEQLAIQALDQAQVINILQEFELMSLRREMESMLRTHTLTSSTPVPREEKSSKQGSLFDMSDPFNGQDPFAPSAPSVAEQLPTVLETVLKLPDCASENVALFPATLYPLLRHEQGYVVGMLAEGSHKHWHVSQASVADMVTWLAKARRVVTPDVKLLLRQDMTWNAITLEQWFDLGLAAYLLRPEDRDYAWARLAVQWNQWSEEAAPLPTTLALNMAEGLQQELQKQDLDILYKQLELPLIPVLARMEKLGIAIDSTAFRHFLDDVQGDIDQRTKEVFEAAGTTFNIRSAQQLGEVLFSTLQLPSAGKTKGGQLSTSQERLEKLSGHPVVDAVLEFRKLEKLRSTYLEPLPRLMDEEGRIHSHFNQWATATGRLSSSNPNLQNIPVRGSLGQRMRSCFIPQAGHVLISADYSQVELRVLAHMSEDPVLLQAFQQNMDIHTNTAAIIYGVAPDLVTGDQRRNAKTINFGLIYGMGAQKLGQELGISTAKAKEFIENYFRHLDKLKLFYEGIEEQAKAQGYVMTLAGRRRAVPDIYSTNNMKFSLARRQAINTVIQGSAADIIKLAMLAVDSDATLMELHAKLALQVHDELVLEVPENTAQQAGERVASLMGAVCPDGKSLRVPLVVDWGVGENWGQAH